MFLIAVREEQANFAVHLSSKMMVKCEDWHSSWFTSTLCNIRFPVLCSEDRSIHPSCWRRPLVLLGGRRHWSYAFSTLDASSRFFCQSRWFVLRFNFHVHWGPDAEERWRLKVAMRSPNSPHPHPAPTHTYSTPLQFFSLLGFQLVLPRPRLTEPLIKWGALAWSSLVWVLVVVGGESESWSESSLRLSFASLPSFVDKG